MTARRTGRRLGQHFLEAAWVEKVVDVIGASAGHHVIEIGPGRGALTLPLAARAGRVLAVEVDTALARELRERVPANVDVVRADFLALDLVETAHRLRPAGAERGAATLRVAGNLPYAASAPILLKLLRNARAAGVRDAVVMLQREVAERVVATAGSRPYGPLAIMTALGADARCVLRLPPGAFRPPPRVRSALVTLRFRDPAAPRGMPPVSRRWSAACSPSAASRWPTRCCRWFAPPASTRSGSAAKPGSPRRAGRAVWHCRNSLTCLMFWPRSEADGVLYSASFPPPSQAPPAACADAGMSCRSARRARRRRCCSS